MRFFVDASCPRLLVDRLRDLGHVVEYAVDLAPGVADGVWAERATRLRQVIVSQDYDFGDIAEVGGLPFGVVQIAPLRGSLESRVDRVVAAIEDALSTLDGAITTVEMHRTWRRAVR